MASDGKISIHRAEAVVLNFTIHTEDRDDAPPEDITGWTLAFTLAADVDLAVKTLTKAGVIVDPPAGKASVALTATETNIAIGSYRYDFWRTDAGQERPLAVGVFKVLGSARVPVSA